MVVSHLMLLLDITFFFSVIYDALVIFKTLCGHFFTITCLSFFLIFIPLKTFIHLCQKKKEGSILPRINFVLYLFLLREYFLSLSLFLSVYVFVCVCIFKGGFFLSLSFNALILQLLLNFLIYMHKQKTTVNKSKEARKQKKKKK